MTGRLALTSLACLLLLTGWTSCSWSRPDPVPAQCDARCFQPCVDAGEDTGVRVAGDPAAAGTWDEIGGRVTRELATRLRQCDVRRQACEQCLQRLEKARVIDL